MALSTGTASDSACVERTKAWPMRTSDASAAAAAKRRSAVRSTSVEFWTRLTSSLRSFTGMSSRP